MGTEKGGSRKTLLVPMESKILGRDSVAPQSMGMGRTLSPRGTHKGSRLREK